MHFKKKQSLCAQKAQRRGTNKTIFYSFERPKAVKIPVGTCSDLQKSKAIVRLGLPPLAIYKSVAFLAKASNSKNLKDKTNTFYNYTFDKGRIKSLVSWSLKTYGEYKTIKLLENLKKTGFEYATKAGISLGIEDLKIPPKKALLLYEAEEISKKAIDQYNRSEITGVERFQRLIDTWHRTSEQLKQEVIDYFENTDILNPVYMMAFSGARGNISQVRQLVGMRGLMADAKGQILDYPIRSNFREGLTITEYIISSYGARKGIVDTALRTANAGYLTRRLVDVAQHVVISNFDCGTSKGVFLNDMKEGNKTIYSLQTRLIGRVLARDIALDSVLSTPTIVGQNKNSALGPKLALRNQEITADLAFEITKYYKKVFVRSPLTCKTKKLVCQLCYGWSQGNLVSIGEAVGIVAAQSIGEPGTQLTMRTFHTGGVFSGDVSDQIRAPYNGYIHYSSVESDYASGYETDARRVVSDSLDRETSGRGFVPTATPTSTIAGTLIRTPEGKMAFLTKTDGFVCVYNNANPLANGPRPPRKWKIPAYTILYYQTGQEVSEKQVIAQISTIARQQNMRDDSELTVKSEIQGQFFIKTLQIQEQFIGPKPNRAGKNIPNKVESGRSLKPEQKQFNPLIMDQKLASWDWGYAWVLSCKLYKIPIFSSEGATKISRNALIPKMGDFVDKNSIMTQIKWFLPQHGGYSIYLQTSLRDSADSANFKILNLKDQNRSNAQGSSHFNKRYWPEVLKKPNNLFSTHALNNINIQKNLLVLDINKIYYKKVGYFLDNPNFLIFLPNNLKRINNSLSKNPRALVFTDRQKPIGRQKNQSTISSLHSHGAVMLVRLLEHYGLKFNRSLKPLTNLQNSLKVLGFGPFTRLKNISPLGGQNKPRQQTPSPSHIVRIPTIGSSLNGFGFDLGPTSVGQNQISTIGFKTNLETGFCLKTKTFQNLKQVLHNYKIVTQKRSQPAADGSILAPNPAYSGAQSNLKMRKGILTSNYTPATGGQLPEQHKKNPRQRRGNLKNSIREDNKTNKLSGIWPLKRLVGFGRNSGADLSKSNAVGKTITVAKSKLSFLVSTNQNRYNTVGGVKAAPLKLSKVLKKDCWFVFGGKNKPLHFRIFVLAYRNFKKVFGLSTRAPFPRHAPNESKELLSMYSNKGSRNKKAYELVHAYSGDQSVQWLSKHSRLNPSAYELLSQFQRTKLIAFDFPITSSKTDSDLSNKKVYKFLYRFNRCLPFVKNQTRTRFNKGKASAKDKTYSNLTFVNLVRKNNKTILRRRIVLSIPKPKSFKNMFLYSSALLNQSIADKTTVTNIKGYKLFEADKNQTPNAQNKAIPTCFKELLFRALRARETRTGLFSTHLPPAERNATNKPNHLNKKEVKWYINPKPRFLPCPPTTDTLVFPTCTERDLTPRQTQIRRARPTRSLNRSDKSTKFLNPISRAFGTYKQTGLDTSAFEFAPTALTNKNIYILAAPLVSNTKNNTKTPGWLSVPPALGLCPSANHSGTGTTWVKRTFPKVSSAGREGLFLQAKTNQHNNISSAGREGLFLQAKTNQQTKKNKVLMPKLGLFCPPPAMLDTNQNKPKTRRCKVFGTRIFYKKNNLGFYLNKNLNLLKVYGYANTKLQNQTILHKTKTNNLKPTGFFKNHKSYFLNKQNISLNPLAKIPNATLICLPFNGYPSQKHVNSYPKQNSKSGFVVSSWLSPTSTASLNHQAKSSNKQIYIDKTLNSFILTFSMPDLFYGYMTNKFQNININLTHTNNSNILFSSAVGGSNTIKLLNPILSNLAFNNYIWKLGRLTPWFFPNKNQSTLSRSDFVGLRKGKNKNAETDYPAKTRYNSGMGHRRLLSTYTYKWFCYNYVNIGMVKPAGSGAQTKARVLAEPLFLPNAKNLSAQCSALKTILLGIFKQVCFEFNMLVKFKNYKFGLTRFVADKQKNNLISRPLPTGEPYKGQNVERNAGWFVPIKVRNKINNSSHKQNVYLKSALLEGFNLDSDVTGLFPISAVGGKQNQNKPKQQNSKTTLKVCFDNVNYALTALASTSFLSNYTGEIINMGSSFANNTNSSGLDKKISFDQVRPSKDGVPSMDEAKNLPKQVLLQDSINWAMANKRSIPYLQKQTILNNKNRCFLLTKKDFFSYKLEGTYSSNSGLVFKGGFLDKKTPLNTIPLKSLLPPVENKSQLGSKNLKIGGFVLRGTVAGLPTGNVDKNQDGTSSVNNLITPKVFNLSGQIIHWNLNKVTIRKAQPFFVSAKTTFHAFHGDFVQSKEPIITLIYQKLKTGDIIQGIPKVEQFFEARTTKRGRLFRDNLPNLLKGLFLKYYFYYFKLLKQGFVYAPETLQKPEATNLNKASSLDLGLFSSNVSDVILAAGGGKNNKTLKNLENTGNKPSISTGNARNLDYSYIASQWAVKQSFYKIQQIAVDGVLRVYRSQGVTISDKHLEIVVKQMTTKVRIIKSGQTAFFPGEIVDLDFVETLNAVLIRKIHYEPIILGITKASLQVDSFLSSASFQQTSKILSQAALINKKDYLKGVKENVILGNLIPAGTGYLVSLENASLAPAYGGN